MASTGNRIASSSGSNWIHDVFLSFRGEDTRNSFVSHLCSGLDRKGIRSYKDDETLKRGRAIFPELLKAIETSRASIVVFSRNYATSTWCLDELAKIMECRRVMGQTVVPIFYDVSPADVRKQVASFAEAFAKHEQDFKGEIEKVDRWREALTQAANLSGWDSRGRSESMLIDVIVRFILNELPHTPTNNAKDLVGIDSHLEELSSMLCIGLDDVRFVGIWGMGGIGKSTIAEVVYDQISCHFNDCCFLANVKEQGFVSLQEKLLLNILMGGRVRLDTPYTGANAIKERLHSREVLLVLDGVDNLEQLEALAGKHDWFGSGSRIIITTRDEQLLVAHNVDKIYKVKELKHQDAVKLFCWKAFREQHPPDDYVELTNSVINYVKGLPLALKVLGSFLCGRRSTEWESALHKLKTCPNEEIQKILRISYDGLDDRQKNLFLDIACFFKDDDRDYVLTILESYGFFPVDLGVLTEKSLITIQDNKVSMHDLLQEMGRDIVFHQSREDPGKRSRLWFHKDVCRVLTKNSGTEEVKGIILDLCELSEINFRSPAFAGMKNLRLLKICYMRSPGGYEYLSRKELGVRAGASMMMMGEAESFKDCKLHLVGGFKFLSNELRCLYWCGFPLKSLPPKFHPQNLVELNMCYSHIRQLWKGTMLFEKLKYMKLSYSQNLKKTPDFSGTPNLERLILEGCTNLVEVHSSIGILRRLILLNLKDCKNLRYLPKAIELESLVSLDLSGCSKFKKFPDISRNMPCLQELYLEGTPIRELPLSIKRLTGLVSLRLEECKNLASLPESLCLLQSLTTLSLSGCSRLDKLPEDLGSLESLVSLCADRTAISRLPSSIVLLKNLSCLSFRGFYHKRSESCHFPFSSLIFPSKDQISRSLELSPLSRLSSLWFLNVSGCNLVAIPDDIGTLSSLTQLDLSDNRFVSLPSSISQLSKLKFLYLKGCARLQELPQLPLAIDTLVADDCISLERLTRASMRKYWFAGFSNCSKLLENQGIEDLVEVLLQSQFQALNPPPYFDVVIPGREIPKWFSHQNMGHFVSIPLPPSWYGCVTGVAMCVVFESREGSRPTISHYGSGLAPRKGSGLAHIYWIGSKNEPESKSYNKKHLWLGYLELDVIWDFDVYCRRDEFAEIIVDFESNPDSGFVIEKCAARLVYKKDAKAENKETIQYPNREMIQDPSSSRGDASATSSYVRLAERVMNLMSWKREWKDGEVGRMIDLLCSGGLWGEELAELLST